MDSTEGTIRNPPLFLKQLQAMIGGFGMHFLECLGLAMISMFFIVPLFLIALQVELALL
jgi:uncharacterized membrane protein